MKVLFIVQTIDFIDPQGIMLLSAIAKTKGYETFLGILSRENIFEKIKNLNPDVIVYSASTGEHKYYLDINKDIKKQFNNIFTVMGGAHATYYPECVRQGSLDAICIGEGDEAFPELLDALEKEEPVDDIANIATRTKRNGLRGLYADLDSLPFPDRDIFYEATEMGRFPIKSFMVSRGCPYACSYCFNHAFREMYKGKGRPVRRKSVSRSIEEILEVKKRYPIQFIKFYDDIFAYKNDPWLEEFCKDYKKEINLPFHCLTRADLVDEDMVRLLKSTGCKSVSMSIESASPYLRLEILNRTMSNEEIYNAFELFYKYNIKTFANSILAIPEGKIKDDIETVQMNVKCKVTFAEFPICHPYPGTKLGKYCQDKGLFDENYEKFHMSYMYESPLNCFTKREKNIQKNLSLLGTVVVWLPFLRWIVYKFLIYLPNNIFYFWGYLLTKIYLIKTKIYPFKLQRGDFFSLFRKSFKVDKFKHSREEKDYG